MTNNPDWHGFSKDVQLNVMAASMDGFYLAMLEMQEFGETLFFTSSLDIQTLIHGLTFDGAISVPLLTESARQTLQQVAEDFHYEPEVKTIGEGDRIVRTEYCACRLGSGIGQYAEFRQAFQGLMDEACAHLDDYPFSKKLRFNELVIQRYLPGQLGITPHRDSLRAINLIVLVNLSGEAEFYHCDDRQGTNAVQLDTTPGNAIFLRAPGFLNTSVRPFHFLTNIRSTRYSLGIRQRLE